MLMIIINKENLLDEFNRHLQLPPKYFLAQDEKDPMRIYLCKRGIGIVNIYLLEHDDFDEIFEVGKEMLNDIYE